MDDLDGIDLVRFVRSTSDSTFLTTPIIMLTGNTEETDVITARDAGINGYLAKPFSAAQFVEHIRAVIDNPSDFIVSTEFIGPDRRHRTDPVPDGVERRKVAGCGSF